MTRKQRYKEPVPCANCGGQHFGSPAGYCPYISKPCVICGDETIYACSDCAIDSGGENKVHICPKVECQRKHEQKHPTATPHDLLPEVNRGAR